ncbi:MAG: hypothetical protein ACUVQT_05615 [bacterium]
MKKILLFGAIIISTIWANQTRMNTLMSGDYIDDPVNIGIYPQFINVFPNTFYGDIFSSATDFGMIMMPVEKYGAIAAWQHKNFNIGYGIAVRKLEFGIMGCPVKDHNRFGIGIGYSSFNSRIDISGIISDETNVNEGFNINLRLLKRMNEYILVPRYSLNIYSKPYDYQSHNIGLLLQRLILNDGFVFLGIEYLLCEGKIEADFSYCFAGFELPLNRTFILRMGARERFDEDFAPVDWQVEAGLGLRIREFNLDFHLNQDRLFNKRLTFFNSFGLDLNFGKF